LEFTFIPWYLFNDQQAARLFGIKWDVGLIHRHSATHTFSSYAISVRYSKQVKKKVNNGIL